MSDNNTNSASSGGIGFAGLLTIAFIVLKLVGVIKWSWVWVLSPIWISAGIVIVILGVVVAIAFVRVIKRELRERNDNRTNTRT